MRARFYKEEVMSNCISCGDELNALDQHPNGDMPPVCARCTTEERHDFDKEPGVVFDRRGERVTTPEA